MARKEAAVDQLHEQLEAHQEDEHTIQMGVDRNQQKRLVSHVAQLEQDLKVAVN